MIKIEVTKKIKIEQIRKKLLDMKKLAIICVNFVYFLEKMQLS
jgi:hypothetical protein